MSMSELVIPDMSSRVQTHPANVRASLEAFHRQVQFLELVEHAKSTDASPNDDSVIIDAWWH